MVVDIDIQHYYKKYIEDASNDLKEYTDKFKLNNDIRKKSKEYLIKRVDYIKKEFNIDLTKYKYSWIIGQYNESEHLKDIAISRLKDTIVGEKRIVLLQLIRYSALLKTCRVYYRNIELAKKRSDLTLAQYKEYVKKFYRYGVHKCILEGYAYHFAYGVGNLMINFWRYETGKNLIDWNATNKKKKELIVAGLKLYDKAEAEIYKIRGIKYDGIPYVQYKNNNEFYNIELTGNRYYTESSFKFKHANYINLNYRGLTIEEISNKCETMEDVYNLPLGIRHKLLICNHKMPTNYLNYIRNDEQYKYKSGAHNSKNRQRFQS